MAATTIAVTLALVFLVVEKHQRIPSLDFSSIDNAADDAQLSRTGIVLSVDPKLAGREEYPRRDFAFIERDDNEATTKHVAVLLHSHQVCIAILPEQLNMTRVITVKCGDLVGDSRASWGRENRNRRRLVQYMVLVSAAVL